MELSSIIIHLELHQSLRIALYLLKMTNLIGVLNTASDPARSYT